MKRLSLLFSVLVCGLTFGSSRSFNRDVPNVLNVLGHCLPEFERVMKPGTVVKEVTFLSPKMADPNRSANLYAFRLEEAGKPVSFRVIENVDRNQTPALVTYECKY